MKGKLLYRGDNALSYIDCGNPNGYPVLVQHGLVASINDYHLFDRLLELGARLIAIARPGYGESSSYTMRNLAEWGDIAGILVDELGLSQFDVFGISSGAPYSYAIAHRLPDRVSKVFILSGVPALYDETVLSLWPYPVNRTAGIAELQSLAHELFFSHASEEDLKRDDVRDSMVNDCFGMAQDFWIRCRDWGFLLTDTQARVYMRHSKTDDDFAAAELTARMLPNCHFEACETGVHYSQEVLDDFITTVMSEHFRKQRV